MLPRCVDEDVEHLNEHYFREVGEEPDETHKGEHDKAKTPVVGTLLFDDRHS